MKKKELKKTCADLLKALSLRHNDVYRLRKKSKKQRKRIEELEKQLVSGTDCSYSHCWCEVDLGVPSGDVEITFPTAEDVCNSLGVGDVDSLPEVGAEYSKETEEKTDATVRCVNIKDAAASMAKVMGMLQ